MRITKQYRTETAHRLMNYDGKCSHLHGHSYLWEVTAECDDNDLASKNPGATELMLDSGAFTAWTKNEEVELDHLLYVYGDLLEKYSSSMKEIWLINLDKIPGSPGRTADTKELDHCIEVSDINFNILRQEFGDRVLPVYHQNESEQRLFDVLDMTPYICVSPRNDLPEKQRVAWSQYVHTLIPGLRAHGLATTGAQMLTTVEWYSADSASWVFAGAMGNITVLNGQRLMPISMSDESPSLKVLGNHFDNMPNLMKQQIADRIEKQGFTVEQMRTSHGHRMAMNMLETIDWMAHLKVNPVNELSLFPL